MSASNRPSSCVVLLNGFPGAGKYSIACALRTKLGNLPTRLLDNHLSIDLAEAVHPGRGPQHKALRRKIWQVVSENLKTLPDEDTIIIMTSCLAMNPEDMTTFAEHVAIAKYRGVPFYSFTVSLKQSEHCRRLQSPERIRGGKKKLTELAVLQHMLDQCKILDPDKDAIVGDGSIEMHHQELDTTDLSMEESVNRVFSALIS